MKLRTNKNSIRLRLSQPEVDEFKKNGFVQEAILFSNIPGNQLTYSLIQSGHDPISVSYINNHLRVYIPSELANQWCDGTDVGFDCTINLNDKSTLYILVEKDFKCMQPRPHEDQSDNYPNPNSKLC